MKKSKIQIIIPVYNAEKYLRRCLESVKNQTFGDWQAIVVDDASADDSKNIIEEYTFLDERFIYIRQETNKGASASRNVALEMVNAEYVAFLDADDYWERDMLESMLEKAEKHSCDIVQCRFIYDFTCGKKVLPKGAFNKDAELSGDLLKNVYIKMMTGINMNHVCMKLIRTSIIKGLRFDTTLKTAEDLKFCIGLFKNVKKYFFVNNVLYHYCRNEESLTGKGLSFKEKFNANRSVSKELVKTLPEWGIDNVFYRMMSYARPYTIAFSKVFRMIREKMSAKSDLL